MKKVFVLVVASLLVAFGLTSFHRLGAAHADGSAMLDAGVTAGSGSAAPASSTLHDPVTDPLGSIGDLKSYKARWPLLVLAILIGLTKVAAFAGGKLAPLGKWLSTGKHGMVVAAVGTLAAIALDSLTSGGTWPTALLAMGFALVGLISPHAPETAQDKHGVA